MSVQNEALVSDLYDGADPKNCRYTDRRPNLWDIVFFSNFNGVIFRGASMNLEAQDLNPLHTSFTAHDTSRRILRLFRKKRLKVEGYQGCEEASNNTDLITDDSRILIQPNDKTPKINMIALVLQAFWPYFSIAAFLSLIDMIAFLTPSYLMGYFYDFLSSDEENSNIGYYIAGSLFVAQQVSSIAAAHVYGTLYNIGIRCLSGFSSAIYQKTLRLSSKASKEFSTGDIVNLISVDLENVMWCITLSVALFSAPIIIVLTFCLIQQYLGWYCLAGVAVILFFMPLNVLAGKVESSLQDKQMKKKDERVELLTEVINNVKVIKLYAWEDSFVQRIRNIRKQESRLMYLYMGASNVFGFLWNCYPFVISTAAIAAYVFLNKDGVLNAKKILVSISYFSAMKFELTAIPNAISLIAKSVVSLRRIRTFLEADEVNPDVIKSDLTFEEEISLKKATLSWTEEENPVLKGVDLSIRKGELVAVVGRVAAGKSSLIEAIIGEMKLLDGTINRRRSSTMAYVPQQSWILNNTIKNNILFGSSLKPSIYHDIVKKCCLVPDLKILPAGDGTEIGEKGVNLSGGQKQRVSLARAVYQDADIYLLDDPLSAVDSHVAQTLFKDIIGPQGLLAKKTRLLVTHTVSILPYVDRIVVVEEGKITHQGTYEEIMEQNIKLRELVETHSSGENNLNDEKRVSQDEPRLRSVSETSTSSCSIGNMERQTSEIPTGRITDEEEMQIGKVRWRVYFEFIWQFGIVGTVVVLLGYTMFQLASSGSLYFVSNWGEQMKNQNGTTLNDAITNMEIYLAFGGAQAISILMGLTALSLGCIWTSTSLHNRMLDTVLKAPMSFFDSTPTGRILNRFSRDVDELDLSLYFTADDYLETLVEFLVVVVLICIQLPQFLALLIPLMAIFLAIQQFYMMSSRQIKRLDAITKSPVLNSFNETVSGTTSIRAYGSQQNFVQNNMRLLDNNQNCTFHEYTGYRWLAVRLNIIGSLLCSAVVVLLTFYRGHVTAATATLIFTFALQASHSLTWIVRIGAQLENSLVSAERVLEYTKLKSEADSIIKRDVDPHWPSRGQVVFENYSTRYREHLDLVIKQISLEISPCEMIGIVGRTGAGKSSLTMALLRIIEAAEGRILIDGVDISKIGLHTLRSRIAMIPQDPILFKGSLRLNVDPEERYTDEQIWAALEKAHLKTKEKGVNFQVDEGGTNLSVGERQLVCLARALLRNSKLLILDEATAAVDLETDALIQRTIREDFCHSTVITIAHRLHTIMDYHRIVVMDKGRIFEVGSPQELLKNPASRFCSMAKDANIRANNPTNWQLCNARM